jgi:hypothetical protein
MGSKEREEMKHRQPPSNEELLAAYAEYMSSIRLGADLIDLQLQVLRLFAEYLDQGSTTARRKSLSSASVG